MRIGDVRYDVPNEIQGITDAEVAAVPGMYPVSLVDDGIVANRDAAICHRGPDHILQERVLGRSRNAFARLQFSSNVGAKSGMPPGEHVVHNVLFYCALLEQHAQYFVAKQPA